MKNLALIPMFFLFAACVWEGPSPAFLDMDPPGPPEYKAGWRDGCESGFATYGTAFYKTYYSFYQDFNMLKNRHYNAAWHEAFNFCRHYNYKWHTNDLTKD